MSNRFRLGFIFATMIMYLISCGTSDRLAKKHDLGKMIVNTANAEPPVYKEPAVVVKKDTTVKLKAVEGELDLRTQTSKVLVKTKAQDNTDSLKNLIFDMARVNVRTLDRAHDNRVGKDSALIVIKQIRDTVNAQKAATHSAKAEHLQLSVTYGMFDYIIGFCLIICTLSAIKTLLPAHWFKKKYTV